MTLPCFIVSVLSGIATAFLAGYLYVRFWYNWFNREP